MENLQRFWGEPGITTVGFSEPLSDGNDTLPLRGLQNLITRLVGRSQQIKCRLFFKSALIDHMQSIVCHDEHIVFV